MRMQVDSDAYTSEEVFTLSTKNTMEAVAFEEEFPFTEGELELKYNDDDNIMFMERQLALIRNRDYMQVQKFINAYMRSMLFDWMMEVSRQFYFKRYTYHLAVVLVDTYLSIVKDISTNHLQLVGVTCLCIAAKTEVSII
jgi:hypothetical protein